jgi:TonB family protein
MIQFLLNYSINAGLIILILWAGYQFALSRNTNFKISRVVLLSIYAFAAILPFVPIVSFIPADIVLLGGNIEVGKIEVSNNPISSRVQLGYILGVIYLIGCLVVTFFLIIGWYKIIRIIKNTNKEEREGYILAVSPNLKTTPFNFWKYVVVNENDATNDAILAHESKHVLYGHSFDLILGQFVLILQWWNPASWLMFRSLRTLHEYQADEGVLTEGFSRYDYELLILNRIIEKQNYFLANTFSSGSLNARIKMMGKRKRYSSKLNYLILIPVIVMAALFPKIPFAQTPIVSTQNITLKETIETMPEYPGGEGAMMRAIVWEIKYPQNLLDKGASGVARIGFTVNANGSMSDFKIVRSSGYEEFDNEAIRAIKSSLNKAWVPGFVDGKPVASAVSIPITFRIAQ